MINEELQKKLVEIGNKQIIINGKLISRYVASDGINVLLTPVKGRQKYAAANAYELSLLLSRYPLDSTVLCDKKEISNLSSEYFR